MGCMEDLRAEIQAAARKRARSKEAFDRDNARLRDLLIQARSEEIGPSEMARLTGLTREWVAKIAPDPSQPKRKVRIVRSKTTPDA